MGEAGKGSAGQAGGRPAEGVGIPRHQKVYAADVALVFPVALKDELGLDHFEGCSWIGLYRHALMTMIAYAFLQSRRLDQAKGGKTETRDRRRNPAYRQ
jgi:SRSO17 transposase